MTAFLLRANEHGEILDADGRVIGKVVPVEPTEAMISNMWLAINGSITRDHPVMRYTWARTLSAATLDLSAVAVREDDIRQAAEREAVLRMMKALDPFGHGINPDPRLVKAFPEAFK
jgi:hypothetical protein